MVRSEGIEYRKDWHPDRFIMIWFRTGEHRPVFSSEKYRKIMSKRKIQWTARPLLLRRERYGDNSDKRERRMG